MSKTVLAEVDGFTPLIDSLLDNPEIGIIGAAVFGRMWRYCQMENGICHASLETIANEIGISRRTVIRYSDALVSLGYLKDLTPEVRNRPHLYADTGKAMLSINVGVTESHTSGVTQSHSRGDTDSHLGVTESHLKKEPKKVSKKETNSCPQEWMNALYHLCGIDVSLASSGMRKRISEAGKALIGAGAKLEDVDRFARWWTSDEWRAKNTPTPTPEKVRDNWQKMSGSAARATQQKKEVNWL